MQQGGGERFQKEATWWLGLFQICLTTQTVVKVAERATWFRVSHCKWVPEPEENSRQSKQQSLVRARKYANWLSITHKVPRSEEMAVNGRVKYSPCSREFTTVWERKQHSASDLWRNNQNNNNKQQSVVAVKENIIYGWSIVVATKVHVQRQAHKTTDQHDRRYILTVELTVVTNDPIENCFRESRLVDPTINYTHSDTPDITDKLRTS